MTHRSWATLTAAVVAATLLMGAGARWVTAGDSDRADQDNCQIHLKQLSLGLMMYTQDYDERFPPASKWATVVMPYVKNREIFSCPSDGNPWSYAFNRNVGGIYMNQVDRPDVLTLLFESNLHRANASGAAAALAKPPRHRDGSNYAYVDGHVKWSKAVPDFGSFWSSTSPRRGRSAGGDLECLDRPGTAVLAEAPLAPALCSMRCRPLPDPSLRALPALRSG